MLWVGRAVSPQWCAEVRAAQEGAAGRAHSAVPSARLAVTRGSSYEGTFPCAARASPRAVVSWLRLPLCSPLSCLSPTIPRSLLRLRCSAWSRCSCRRTPRPSRCVLFVYVRKDVRQLSSCPYASSGLRCLVSQAPSPSPLRPLPPPRLPLPVAPADHLFSLSVLTPLSCACVSLCGAGGARPRRAHEPPRDGAAARAARGPPAAPAGQSCGVTATGPYLHGHAYLPHLHQRVSARGCAVAAGLRGSADVSHGSPCAGGGAAVPQPSYSCVALSAGPPCGV